MGGAPRLKERMGMRLHIGFLVGALSSLALLAPSTASAEGLESCGNIELSAEAQCTAELEGGCTAKCTPVNFEIQCAAQCDGECTASV